MGASPTITGTSSFVGTQLTSSKRRALTARVRGKVRKRVRLVKAGFGGAGWAGEFDRFRGGEEVEAVG